MSAATEPIAAAPISWGVSEVPGWGHQMDPERVLAEMRALGFRATEAGPEGFLPTDPGSARDLCATHELQLIGGFAPATLHRADPNDRVTVTARAEWLAAAGAQFLVLACTTGTDGYDANLQLDAAARDRLSAGVDWVADIAQEHGLTAVLHPHVGTVVERPDQVAHLLETTRIQFCLDTGHLMIGGIDPVQFARDAGHRISLLQLKDVDARLAAAVQDGRRSYTDAVRAGIYGPLGSQDVDVAAVLAALGDYDSWYVMEQDTVIAEEPEPGTGPVIDVRQSREYLIDVLATQRSAQRDSLRHPDLLE